MATYDFIAQTFTNDFKECIVDEKLYSFFMYVDWDGIPIKVCKSLFHTWLYSNCVALGDRMSMASSVENRNPFLDYKFIELVIGLRKTYSDDYKLGYKRWFIDAMNGTIPEEILKRQKRGFTPPYKEWYMAIVKRYGNLCCDGYLTSKGIIDRNSIAEFINNRHPCNDLFSAYKIILLEVWCRRFIMGESGV